MEDSIQVTVNNPSPRLREDELDIEHLQAACEEAMEDDGPGLDPEPIFARLREEFVVNTNR